MLYLWASLTYYKSFNPRVNTGLVLLLYVRVAHTHELNPLIPLQNHLPISIHGMVGSHKIIFISLAKWIMSQTYHVNIEPLVTRLYHIPRRIRSISQTDQNSTCHSLNRMAGAFKLLLCSNTSDRLLYKSPSKSPWSSFCYINNYL